MSKAKRPAFNPLEKLDPATLVKLSDTEFEHSVKQRARALASDAIETYKEVMDASDDDAARVNAADRILKYSEAQKEEKPTGGVISEEVLRLALAGIGSLALIAKDSTSTAILRNVTPAKADTRAFPDIDPLNVAVERKEGEREEAKIEEAIELDEQG